MKLSYTSLNPPQQESSHTSISYQMVADLVVFDVVIIDTVDDLVFLLVELNYLRCRHTTAAS